MQDDIACALREIEEFIHATNAVRRERRKRSWATACRIQIDKLTTLKKKFKHAARLLEMDRKVEFMHFLRKWAIKREGGWEVTV